MPPIPPPPSSRRSSRSSLLPPGVQRILLLPAQNRAFGHYIRAAVTRGHVPQLKILPVLTEDFEPVRYTNPTRIILEEDGYARSHAQWRRFQTATARRKAQDGPLPQFAQSHRRRTTRLQWLRLAARRFTAR